MRKNLIFTLCFLLFAGAVLAQSGDDPALKANASSSAVQEELDQPDGVAITVSPDGNFQIFSRGTGVYDFNDSDDIKDARRDATMRAKANLAKFLNEKVSSAEGLDEITKKAKSMNSDGNVETKAVSKESLKITTESIRNQAEQILTGVITLKDQKVPRGSGGEIQVTVGISSKTLRAAQMLGKGINESLSNREADGYGGASASPSVSPVPNRSQTRYSDTDF